MIVTPQELSAINGQAVREYPSECCGVIVSRGGERRLLPLRNIQDELHRMDPNRYPRTSRTAYHVDARDYMTIERLLQEGFSVAVVYHSHIDVGAYFSETDKRQALLGQDPNEHDPIFADATYLVVSVVPGRVQTVAAFRWDRSRRDFVAVEPVTSPPAHQETVE
ncbi:MAG: Mov34/MPN/PAD-1 family protein [Candidatus Rokuibacteriota bacterium]